MYQLAVQHSCIRFLCTSAHLGVAGVADCGGAAPRAAGLPEAVAHVAGAHSPEGQFVTRSLYCTIIHQADYAFWDVLRSAGLLRQA